MDYSYLFPFCLTVTINFFLFFSFWVFFSWFSSSYIVWFTILIVQIIENYFLFFTNRFLMVNILKTSRGRSVLVLWIAGRCLMRISKQFLLIRFLWWKCLLFIHWHINLLVLWHKQYYFIFVVIVCNNINDFCFYFQVQGILFMMKNNWIELVITNFQSVFPTNLML